MNKKNILKPGLPSGFQNQWGTALFLKKKLLKIIEKNFIKFGYSPLETSPMQLSSVIGNSLSEDEENPMSDIFTYNENKTDISLRYDLSQTCINFYKQNYMDLPNPFKRYEIGTVYRREKPGSNRYKSFDQCDADIIGNFDAKQANADLCSMIGSIFTEFLKKSEFVIYVSNRKIVQGLMDELKINDEKQRQKVLRAIDKLDKPGFGLRGVEELLKEKRTDPTSGAVIIGAKLDNSKASEIINFLKIKDLEEIKSNLKNPISQEGIKEISDLLKNISYGDYKELIKFDLSKIRGLDIYTGFIVETNLTFEVKNPKGKVIDIGSVCSGGEYLVSKFKGDDFKGSGVSFGSDRLCFSVQQLDQIEINQENPVIVCVMDKKYLPKYYEILKVLRDNKINAEIFLDPSKNMGKQLTYSNRAARPLAVICGDNEFKDNTVTLKNLLAKKGEDNQITIPRKDLINEIRKIIPKNN